MASQFQTDLTSRGGSTKSEETAKKRRILANLSDTILACRKSMLPHDENDNSKRRIRSAASVSNKTLSEEPVLREVGSQTQGSRFKRSASSLVRRLSDYKNRTGFL